MRRQPDVPLAEPARDVRLGDAHAVVGDGQPGVPVDQRQADRDVLGPGVLTTFASSSRAVR